MRIEYILLKSLNIEFTALFWHEKIMRMRIRLLPCAFTNLEDNIGSYVPLFFIIHIFGIVQEFLDRATALNVCQGP